MNEFTTTLRGRLDDARQALGAAREAGHDYEVQLHCGRIEDLLELAARNGIDTGGWVDPIVLGLCQAD